MIDNQINRIEELLAHQEKQINDLSEMVNRQWQEIDLLKQRLEQAHHKLTALENKGSDVSLAIGDLAAQEKPPHY